VLLVVCESVARFENKNKNKNTNSLFLVSGPKPQWELAIDDTLLILKDHIAMMYGAHRL
jgi:hypothetical protein